MHRNREGAANGSSNPVQMYAVSNPLREFYSNREFMPRTNKH